MKGLKAAKEAKEAQILQLEARYQAQIAGLIGERADLESTLHAKLEVISELEIEKMALMDALSSLQSEHGAKHEMAMKAVDESSEMLDKVFAQYGNYFLIRKSTMGR